MAKRNFFIKESELDDYQIRIVNKHIDKSLIVKGCAGSGKSILALWKAKSIQEGKKGSFLMIIFTNALKQYMQDGVNQIGISPSHIESSNKCYEWRKVNDKWIQDEWKKGDYDYIIVDEAQDFSQEDILTFKNHATKALLLYGDSAQQLYTFQKGKKHLTMQEIENITGFKTEGLVFNHRLPQKIAKLAELISSDDDDIVDRCKNEGFEKPNIFKYDDFEDEMNAIVSIIQNRTLEDVGILLRSNDEVKRVSNALIERGINTETKIYNDSTLDFNTSNPKIMTYHSSKGLQFEAVFLPECTTSDEGNRNALYVALTRTYQSLYIMHTGNLSSFFDSIPKDIYETSLFTETEEL